MLSYCIKCQTRTKTTDITDYSSNGKDGKQGVCSKCGTKMVHFFSDGEPRNLWEKIIKLIKSILGLVLKVIVIIIIIVILINAAPKVIDFFKVKTWSLFIYSTETPNTNYLIQRIDGYKSQTECMEKGISLSKSEGSYECGYYCRVDKYFFETCREVCNRYGCRD
jgi:hypothetical protein